MRLDGALTASLGVIIAPCSLTIAANMITINTVVMRRDNSIEKIVCHILGHIAIIGSFMCKYKYEKFKYEPESYTNILGLSCELALFYDLYFIKHMDDSIYNKFALEKHARDLFFTIKHRALEGVITKAEACELSEYIEDLLDD